MSMDDAPVGAAGIFPMMLGPPTESARWSSMSSLGYARALAAKEVNTRERVILRDDGFSKYESILH